MKLRAAAMLAVSVLAAASLAGCGTDDGDAADDPTDSPSTSTTTGTTTEPTSEPTTEPPTATDSATPATVAVPAYFVGATPIGRRLYREFRDVPADNPTDEAFALIGAGDALDPDYSTLLPGSAPTLVSQEPLVVALPDASWAERPSGMTTKGAKLAVQQLVYTVQGVLQDRQPVQFVLGDESTPVFGITEPQGGFTAAKSLNVLALVNVTEPAEGQSVSGTFTASGVASSFEGTVPWEVRDQSGAMVLEGFAQADGWIDDLYPWESPVDVSTLAPGSYTFVAMTDDPSGGEGGGPTEDTKTITVQ